MARPKLGDSETERLHVKMAGEEIAAIDDWRYENRIPSRSEAVRRLCQMGVMFARFSDFLRTDGANLSEYLATIDRDAPDGETVEMSRSRLHDLRIFTAAASWAAARGMRFSGAEELRSLIEDDERVSRIMEAIDRDVEESD